MKEMKHKKVIVKCLKDSRKSHYQETFHNISEHQVTKELNKMIEAAPWNGFVINCDGQVKTLVLNC